MSDIQSRLKSLADGQAWAKRGASFMAKAKATKAVWFPPGPARTTGKSASKAKKATKRTTKRAAKKAS